MAYVDQPEDLASRIRRIEAELADLRRRSGLSSATIRRGGITLTDDSRLNVVDADGDLLLRVGSLGYDYDDGRPQQGFEAHYENGAPALAVWNPEHGQPSGGQFVAAYNHSGPVVLGTDAESSFGLARPWLPVVMQRLDAAGLGQTTSASFAAVYEAFSHQQHPWIAARCYAYADAGTTGEVRLTVNGTQVGDVITLAAGGSAVEARQARVEGLPFGGVAQVLYEMRRTGGTGAVYGKADVFWRQSP